ncbi:MAG TPA: DUF167 domain-containing protein [Solimonas sp.]|nr:DUF167 domain-containing protein [Solimonas sp.]
MSLRLSLKVSPKAARNAIGGWMGDTLKLSVTAPPERGKANAAVIALLADALDLPQAAFTLLQGETAARKLVAITGLDEGEILRRLRKPGV